MRAGKRSAWAIEGEGRDSMTETSSAVERGSQSKNIVVRSTRGSFDRRTWGNSLMLRNFVIFSRLTVSLPV